MPSSSRFRPSFIESLYFTFKPFILSFRSYGSQASLPTQIATKSAWPLNCTMEPPKNWLQTIENIRKVRQKHPAPVDSMGCSQANQSQDAPVDKRFQVLTSLLLSSQTKDPITWAAAQKLREAGLGKVDGVIGAKEKDIEDLIYPVGFYRRKAGYLKEIAKVLKDKYHGDIPQTVKELCELPGFGPKMAHLCMLGAWDEVTGIGVDVHVHRISERLGWVPKKMKTPEDTRKALESWLPRDYWREINHLLVGFGQTICKPIGPLCTECDNNEICPSANLNKKVKKSKSPKKTKDEPRVKVKEEPVGAIEVDARVKKEPDEPNKNKSLIKKGRARLR